MAVIGHATARSAAGIARVYVETWRSAYAGLLPDRVLVGLSVARQTQEWAQQIRAGQERNSVLVAVEGETGVVGMCTIGPSRGADLPVAGPFDGREPAGKIGEIYTLYVLPEHQERGIGRQLLAAGFSGLVARGFERAFLWTLRDNPARFFYEHLGGTPVAGRVERLWGTDVPQVAYGWPDLKVAATRIGSCSTI